jgi:zinc transport system substrate-binding protein
VPEVLMKDNVSPHHFHLLPSHMETLKTADLVMWVGPDMENAFEKTIESLSPEKVITAMDIHPIKILPIRAGHCDCHHHHDHEHHHEHDHEPGFWDKVWAFFGWKQKHHHAKDPHLWTNPDNMLILAKALKTRLVHIDIRNSEIYEKNYQDFERKIQDLQRKIKETLKPSKESFFVFHDALQYLEDYAGLKGNIVQGNDEIGFSLKEIVKLKESLAKVSKKCVLTDESLPASKISQMLGDLQGLKIQEISPEGIGLKISDDIYFHIMDNMITKIHECLN